MTITSTPEAPAESSSTTLISDARQRAKRRRVRWGSLAVALVTALAFTVGLWPSSSHSPSSAIPSPYAGAVVANKCLGSSLFPMVEGETGGAGSFAVLVILKNIGKSTCALTGYPALTLGTGTRPVALTYNTSPSSTNGFGTGLTTGKAVPSYNLPVGQLASFWIEGSDEPAGSAAACHNSQSLQVSVGRAPVRASLHFDPNTHPLAWCGSLTVLPMLPGNSGTLPAQPLSKFFG